MKYIFIDSNQYRHLFSKNEGFSDKTKSILDELIKRQQIQLLIPQQVHEEVERNRLENWYAQELNDTENRIKNKTAVLEKKKKELTSYPDEFTLIAKKIKKEIAVEEKELKRIATRFRSPQSKASRKLKSLLDAGEIISENEEIVAFARLRVEKGNPPQDNKLGDALIWESLLHYLSRAEANSTLIFVARDGDAWGVHGFNPWLAKELKEKCGVTVTLAESLSDIEELTKEEQDAIRQLEREESKSNALLSFVNSRSWVRAGENLRSLMAYADLLTESDFAKIITASVTNSEIYKSFYTSSKLNHICRGEDGYVLPELEPINDTLWKKFIELNQVELRRKKDETVDDLDF
jgi:hypothetical protein